MFLMLDIVKKNKTKTQKNPTIVFASLVLKAYVFLKCIGHSTIQIKTILIPETVWASSVRGRVWR